jgi:subtilisin-like proprotein convertase family protein
MTTDSAPGGLSALRRIVPVMLIITGTALPLEADQNYPCKCAEVLATGRYETTVGGQSRVLFLVADSPDQAGNLGGDISLDSPNTNNRIGRNMRQAGPRPRMETLVFAPTAEAAAAGDPARCMAATGRVYVRLAIDGDVQVVAAKVGAVSYETLPYGANNHVLFFGGASESIDQLEMMKALPDVELATLSFGRHYQPQFVPDDELFSTQWNMRNFGQFGGTVDEDANLVPAWDITRGEGTVLAIVDSGVNVGHPDLPNYRPELSYDFACDDDDPHICGNFAAAHGTNVAGIAAAVSVGDGEGVTGAAPEAEFSAIRIIASTCGITDDEVGDSLVHGLDVIDISNNSWGWGNGFIEGLEPIIDAVEHGATTGRDGKGVIYIWASGNGYSNGDDTNYDVLQTNRYKISVSGTDFHGQRINVAEPGATILVNCPAGQVGGIGVPTTDPIGSCGASPQDYYAGFNGTSSAAPMATGIAALMLSVNESLTWRDVQHIFVNSTEQNDPFDPDWTTNGAGRWVNHQYGFGRLDAFAAVMQALTWKNVALEATPATGTEQVATPIPDGSDVGLLGEIEIADDLSIEHVEVIVNITHPRRGHLDIRLTSPSGTESVLASQRTDIGADYSQWKFLSVRHWDESSMGTWQLEVVDDVAGQAGVWVDWSMVIHGTSNESLYGDSDGDGDVDLLDFGQFQLCFTGEGGAGHSSECGVFDSDDDDDVDLADFAAFQTSFTGMIF